MKYNTYIIKRKIESVFIYPFILLGKCIALLKPLKKEYNIFYFFPFYHTGGAENVHALITLATGDSNCIIFFTKTSADTTFLKQFQLSNCDIKNISSFTDNKWLYFLNLIYRGIIVTYINKQSKTAIVFNGQCNFAYKISPWIKKEIKIIELIHSFNSFSWIRIPFIPYLHQTIMISKVRINDHIKQHQTIGIPQEFSKRIKYISNGIELPENAPNKNYNNHLNILYVGRGTIEKRVHIIAAIAEEVHKTNPEINFIFAGDVANAIPENLKQHCILKGNIVDKNELTNLYKQAHILLITSSTEGFPLVVMEAMANGCTIIATPVGDIPIHIQNNQNGQVVTEVDNENKIIEEMKKFIIYYQQHKYLLEENSLRNIHYAQQNFSIHSFNKAYKKILSK